MSDRLTDERLEKHRRHLRDVSGSSHTRNLAWELLREVDALKAERDKWHAEYDKAADANHAGGYETIGLQARVAELAEALENLADGIEQYTGPVRQLAVIARAALAGESTEKP